MEDRINYFERMLADNPDNPTGLLALANEYGKAERFEDEAAVLERYVATHEHERTMGQHTLQIRFRALLTKDFFVRLNNGTRSLDVEEAFDYISSRDWGGG